MSAPAVSIDLDKLPEHTRSQIIAKSARDGVSTKQVMQDMITGQTGGPAPASSTGGKKGGSK